MQARTLLKRGRRQQRAYQYRVLSERLQFHAAAGNLPPEVEPLVQTAADALTRAAQILAEIDGAIESPPLSQAHTS